MEKRKVFFGVKIIGLILLLLLTNCIIGRARELGNTDDKVNSEEIGMSIWGEEFSFDTTNTEYNISCRRLTTEFPIEFSFEVPTGYTIKINNQIIDENVINYQIDEINAMNNTIEIVFQNDGGSINVHMQTLPFDYPMVSTVGEGVEPGVYYYAANGYLTKMNEKGEIIYYQKEALKNGEGTDVVDFKQIITESGKKRYCFGRRAYTNNLPTYQAYEWVIMDENYNVINIISTMSLSENINNLVMHDNHDILLIDDNHYIEAAYVHERVYNIPKEVGIYEYGANVQAVVIQEVMDGEVIWTWNSTDYPELYGMCTDDLTNDTDLYANYTDSWSDYAHLNSFVIDPKDGNLVCSFRHFDAIIEINRSSGDIEWVLGGNKDEFDLSEEQKFSHQHAAWFTKDNTIILFDNANNKGYSRVVEVGIDEKNKVLTSYNTYMPEKQTSLWMGSAQKISDNTILIGWGGRGGVARNTLLFSEFNLETKEVVFEAVCDVDNYRVYRFED